MDPLVFDKSNWTATNFQKGTEVTALDICQKYIVIASKCGFLHFYSHEKFMRQHRILIGDELITEVSISSDPGYLAYANSSGRSSVLRVSHVSPEKQLYPIMSDEHVGSTVTVITWSPEGKDLYIGDSEGKVSSLHLPSNIASSLLMNVSQKLLDLHSPVIQMGIHGNLLIISTCNQSYICHIDLETYSTMGTQAREGRFGCCFYVNKIFRERSILWCPESAVAGRATLKSDTKFWSKRFNWTKQYYKTSPDKDLCSARILCARPETRLWECNTRGEVISQYKVKSKSQKTLADNDFIGCGPNCKYDTSNVSFEQIIQLDSIHIVAFSATRIFLIDMETVCIKTSLELHKRIVKAKVCECTIILLFEDKSVEMYKILNAINIRCNLKRTTNNNGSKTSSSEDTLTSHDAVVGIEHVYSDSHSPNSDTISELQKHRRDSTRLDDEWAVVCEINMVSSEEPLENGSPKEDSRSVQGKHHLHEFLEHTSRLYAENYQNCCVTELEFWLHTFLIHNEESSEIIEVVPRIHPSRKVSQMFLMCMKNHIVTNNTVVRVVQKKCYHKRTPINVRGNDIFYSQLIDSDIGLLDASFIMNNLDIVGPNLYPLVWSSLLEKISIDQPADTKFNLSELDMLEDLKLDRSHIVLYLINSFGFDCLNEFVQAAVVLSYEHVVEDVLYFLLWLEPFLDYPESFKEEILRNFLLSFDKSIYYYQLHWSSSPELQYEIIKSLLSNNVSICPCLGHISLDRKSLDILEVVFNLPLYDIKETLQICIKFHFFYGIFSIFSHLPSYLVIHLLPIVFQFGNEDDIANFVRFVPNDMYGDILKFLEYEPVTETCVLCGNSLNGLLTENEVSPLKRNYFTRKFMERFLDAILIQGGPGTVLDVLENSEKSQSLSRKFYQNCIKAHILLSKSNETTNEEMFCPQMNFQLNPNTSSLKIASYSEDKTLIDDLVSLLAGYLKECTWPVHQLISKYMQNLNGNASFNSRLVTQNKGSRNKNVPNNLSRYYHWGIEVSLMGRCKLCTLNLNIPEMIRAGGLTVFICGCVVHSACVRNDSCPYCDGYQTQYDIKIGSR